MKIGLVGYGKMGKMIEQAALARGHRIEAVIDPFAPEEKTASGTVVCRSFSVPPGGDALGGQAAGGYTALAAADVYIEFTRPETAPDNIKAVLAAGKPVICGSTGWYEKLPDIAAAQKASPNGGVPGSGSVSGESGGGVPGGSFLWSSNFSLGVNLFYRIASHAARLIDPFGDYDAGGLEVHHNKKADSPSGTAAVLMERVLAVMKRKTHVIWDTPQHKMETDAIHFGSLRYGAVPGTHSLFFDSPADTIEITHTARSREGFALGAVIAAEWLLRSGPGQSAGEARQGIFTMDDVLVQLPS